MKLIKHLSSDDILDLRIGTYLSRGEHGEVYSYLLDYNKVVKLTLNNLVPPYDKLKDYDHFVKVYDHKILDRSLCLQYIVMENLNDITDDEYKVFHTILSHEDANKTKELSRDELTNTLKGLSYGLEFDTNQVTKFYLAIKNCPYIHNDIHPRNILKTTNGQFKLIDLDSIKEYKNGKSRFEDSV